MSSPVQRISQFWKLFWQSRATRILLSVLYVVLLVSFLWLPHTAPRRIIRLRVDDHGGITLTSWRKSGAHDIAIEIWNEDLNGSRRLPVDRCLSSFTHGLSPDGDRIAFVVQAVSNNQLIITDRRGRTLRQWDTIPDDSYYSGIPLNLGFAGTNSSLLLYNAGGFLYLIDSEGEVLSRVRSAMIAATLAGNHVITCESRPLSEQANLNDGEEQVTKFYEVTQDGFVLLREARGLDWRFSGYTISRQGTIAIQREKHIIIEPKGEPPRQVECPDELGVLVQFSPDERHLLFKGSDSYFVVNSLTLKREGRYRIPELIQCFAEFQDNNHVLVWYEMDSDTSDRLVRWKWRYSEVNESTLGGISEKKRNNWRRTNMVGLVAFLVLVFCYCTTAYEPLNPAVPTLGMLTGTLVWAYGHPDFEFNALDANTNSLPGISYVIAWLVIGCLTTFVPWIVRIRFLPWLSGAIAVSSFAGYRIATLWADPRCFFFLAFFFAIATILFLTTIRSFVGNHNRLTKWGAGNGVQAGRDGTSFRLADLFFLVASAAVVFALFSRLGAFRQPAQLLGGAIIYGVALCLTATMACWAAIGSWKWWLRYPVAFAVAFAVSCFLAKRLIEANVNIYFVRDELAVYNKLLGLAVWYFAMLFRGSRTRFNHHPPPVPE